MLREKPGNAVIMTWRNRPGRSTWITASVDAGLNVLADKPWIIKSADMPKLERVLNKAEKKGLVAYDIMTERFEITSILQRALVNDEGLFGKLLPGSDAGACCLSKEHSSLDEGGGGCPAAAPGLVL